MRFIRTNIPIVFLMLIMTASIIESSEEPVTKTFLIKYRRLNDVALKIKPFISNSAKINLDYSNNRLQVQDTRANIDLVEREIHRFDRPPYKIGIRITVISAGKEKTALKDDGNIQSLPKNISNIPSELNKILKYNKYHLLDNLLITTKEGENYTMSENDRYNLHFYSDYIDSNSGAVVLKDFTLFLKNRLPSGVTTSKRLLRTDINLIPGQRLILGGADKEDSPDALFFIIETEAAE